MWNGDMTSNMGISIYLITIVIFLVIVIVFAGVYISRKYARSAKT